jgi:hypothetical protein
VRNTAIEKIFQRASLVGHVVEDLSFANVNPSRFRAELIGRGDAPQYKDEGFFVFSNLREGGYTLKITGERLQPATFEVEIPAIPPERHVFLEPAGDSELIVIARTVEDDAENVGGKKLTFDPVILTRQIRAGSRVVSDSLPPDADPAATLAATLEAGEVSSARVMNADGLAADSVVRFIRDKSVRMRLDPYYIFESPITRVAGKVVSQQNAERPLAGARVRLTEVNDAPVNETDVHGLRVFTGQDVAGGAIVLGTEKDISALTNERGDYNLYFSNETLASHKITDGTVQALDNANAPQKVLDVLEDGALKDKVFRGRDRFLAALREASGRKKLGHEVLLKFQPLILEHSEGFVRKLTLEATLAGFEPASVSASISTAERKVVNFELTKS